MMTYKNFRKQQKDRSLNRQVGTTASDQSSNIGYIRAYVKDNSFDRAPASEFESLTFQLLLEHFLTYGIGISPNTLLLWLFWGT